MNLQSVRPSHILELRQYTLKPGCRDTLVDVFDRYLVDGQEEVGMEIVGQFRDLDDPDRFVWLRGFASMDIHAEALGAFYYGPVWRAHSSVANATMVDSDNVLLLESLDGGSLRLPAVSSIYGPAAPRAPSVLAIEVAYLEGRITPSDRSLADRGAGALLNSGAEVLAVLTTHEVENDFPALPIRDEHVLVWISRLADDAAHAASRERLAQSDEWQDVLAELGKRGNGQQLQQLRLRPTDGSHLR